jgi:hypothetical protein
VAGPSISQSGSSYTISFRLGQSAVLEDGELNLGGDALQLGEFEHAGVALVPMTVRTRAGMPIENAASAWQILLWRDSRSTQTVGPRRPPSQGRNPARDGNPECPNASDSSSASGLIPPRWSKSSLDSWSRFIRS